MAAHGAETEGPGELEDLQIILSLADNADEEFMEDVIMLKEAEPFEVKEVTSVLQMLSSNCEASVWSFLCGARDLTPKGASAKTCHLHTKAYRWESHQAWK